MDMLDMFWYLTESSTGDSAQVGQVEWSRSEGPTTLSIVVDGWLVGCQGEVWHAT